MSRKNKIETIISVTNLDIEIEENSIYEICENAEKILSEYFTNNIEEWVNFINA